MTLKETLTGWLNALQSKEWAKLPALTQKTYKSDYADITVAAHIQSYWIHYELKSWKILAEAAPEDKNLHTFEVEYETNFGTLRAYVSVIRESAPFELSLTGTWGVNLISALPSRKLKKRRLESCL